MPTSHASVRLLLAVSAFAVASSAVAQPLGVFRWQQQPYCNIISVTVTQNGGIYTLDGTDDQCGAASQGSVSGIAFLNPNGTIGFGLTVVATPGGAPVHIDATIGLPGLSGTWRDSAGAQGPFVLTPGAGSGGAARPLRGLGGASVNAAQVQLRVSGACGAGQAIASINEDGSVNCLAAGAGGITSIAAGVGLIGGASGGAATLAVNFGGTGAANAVARADHTHARAASSTSVGTSALEALSSGAFNTAVGSTALRALTTGGFNTAIGADSLPLLTNGNYNTAVGTLALASLTSGDVNTAVGNLALVGLGTGEENTVVGANAAGNLLSGSGNTVLGRGALGNTTTSVDNTAVGNRAMGTGEDIGQGNTAVGAGALASSAGLFNTAVGWHALHDHSAGGGNVAIGDSALLSYPFGGLNTAVGTAALKELRSGEFNVAVGQTAGANLVTGSNNLYLAHDGNATETGTIRLGRPGNHSRAFVAAVRGVQVEAVNGINVIIDSNGQLGTTNSSRRTKEDIADLGPAGRAVQRLRPVQFRYIKPYADGSKPIEYGLIAEEVATVLPELVAYGADGHPESVKYHVLPTLLLAEIQRLERERAAHMEQLDRQAREVAALRATIEALAREVAARR